MKLNDRLTKVANMVCDNTNVIDIGCDHGLLDIYLYKNKKNIRVVATDNKEKPLKQAHENIKKSRLSDKIEIRLGNGLDTIDDKIDTVIISGMGGFNIVGILKYKIELLKNVKTLILSPNNEVFFLRKEIVKLGYVIVDEELVKDKDKIYPVIKFEKGKYKYSKKEYIYGPILIEKKDLLLKENIEKERQRINHVLKIMPKGHYLRKFKLKRELKLLLKI